MSKRKAKVIEVKPQTAAIYVRVSTDEQIEAQGLDVQLDMCQTYAQAYKLPIFKVYSEEGVSGAKPADKRPALSELMQAAHKGEFNTLIVPAIDRLGRDLGVFLKIWDELEAAGIKIILVKERLETDSPSGLLMRNILATFADYERAVIRERTMGGRRKRAARDGERGGTLPFGYTRHGQADVRKDKASAAIVTQIFTLRKQGLTMQAIANKLNAQGLKTQRGGNWHGSSVKIILDNEPKYRGGSMNGSPINWPVILK